MHFCQSQSRMTLKNPFCDKRNWRWFLFWGSIVVVFWGQGDFKICTSWYCTFFLATVIVVVFVVVFVVIFIIICVEYY